MAAETPLTSTPMKGKYSSLFKELARLPSRLFGYFPGNTFDLLKMDMAKNPFLIPQDGTISPCRHSPRLLSNGYYTVDEESLCSDEFGNISITPTQYNVSYKENVVRIFRRRRKPHAQRCLDLQSRGKQEDCLSLPENDIYDCEPLVLERPCNCHSEITDPGNAASTSASLCPTRHSLRTYHENAGIGNKGNMAASLLHATPPPRTGGRVDESAQHPPSVSPQHMDHVTTTLLPIAHSLSMAEMETYVEEMSEHCSNGGYVHVDNGVCTVSYDITNWTPARKRNLNKMSQHPEYPAVTVEAVFAEQVDAEGWKKYSHVVIIVFCVFILLFATFIFSQSSNSKDMSRHRKVT